MNNWVEKLLNILIRALVTVVTGGGVITASEWSWFGTIVFTNFASSLDITFQNRKLIRYQTWNASLLFDSLPVVLGLGAFLGLIGLMLLLAHVLFKKTRQALQQGQSAAAALQPGPNRLIRLCRTLAALYVRYYFIATVVVFFALSCCLWLFGNIVILVVLFLLIALPGTLYLLLYSKDLIHGEFGERFVYITITLCFFLALVGLPRQYGQQVFDPDIWQVITTGADRAEDLTFVFEEQDGLLATLVCSGGAWTVVLTETAEDLERDTRPATLRNWKEVIKPCAPKEDLPEFDELFG